MFSIQFNRSEGADTDRIHLMLLKIFDHLLQRRLGAKRPWSHGEREREREREREKKKKKKKKKTMETEITDSKNGRLDRGKEVANQVNSSPWVCGIRGDRGEDPVSTGPRLEKVIEYFKQHEVNQMGMASFDPLNWIENIQLQVCDDDAEAGWKDYSFVADAAVSIG